MPKPVATFLIHVVAVASGAAAVAFAPSAAAASCSMNIGTWMRPGVVGQPYSEQIPVFSGGTAPYTFKVVQGGLPLGLTLSPSGLISGTPRLPDAARPKVQVTDSSTPSPCVATADVAVHVGVDASGISGVGVPDVALLVECTVDLVDQLVFAGRPGSDCFGVP